MVSVLGLINGLYVNRTGHSLWKHNFLCSHKNNYLTILTQWHVLLLLSKLQVHFLRSYTIDIILIDQDKGKISSTFIRSVIGSKLDRFVAQLIDIPHSTSK